MDLDETSSSTSSTADAHPITSSIPTLTSSVHTVAAETLPPIASRPSTTPRNSAAAVKLESPARPAPTTLSAVESREVKPTKDSVNMEEQSEYVHHIIDPSSPVYELTHGVPDSLALKCSDCSRYARGTYLFHWSLASTQPFEAAQACYLEIVSATRATTFSAD